MKLHLEVGRSGRQNNHGCKFYCTFGVDGLGFAKIQIAVVTTLDYLVRWYLAALFVQSTVVLELSVVQKAVLVDPVC